MKKDFDIGTTRIKSSTLKQHINTSTSWDFLDELPENLNGIILFYLKNNILCYLIVEKRGQGTYTSPNGEKYLGEWEDGVYNGLGTWI